MEGVAGGGAVTFGRDPVGDSAARRRSGCGARCPGLGGTLRALGIGNDLGSGCPPGVIECGVGGSLPAHCSGNVSGSIGDQAELIWPGGTGGNGWAGNDTCRAAGPGGRGGGRAIGENWAISQGNAGGLYGCAMVG